MRNAIFIRKQIFCKLFTFHFTHMEIILRVKIFVVPDVRTLYNDCILHGSRVMFIAVIPAGEMHHLPWRTAVLCSPFPRECCQ